MTTVGSRLRDARRRLAETDGPAVVRPRPPGPRVASSEQEWMWLLDRVLGGSTDYHVPHALRITGPFDEHAFGRALTALVHRHEVLRTVFHDNDSADGPRPVVLPATPVLVEVHDVEPLPAAGPIDGSPAVRAAVDTVERPFDLAADPPMRATVLRCGPRDRLLVLTLHHIATDGASTEPMWRELSEHYAAAAAGSAPSTRPPALQYADYAHWQRTHADTADLEYWARRLADPRPLDLPLDRDRPTTRHRAGDEVRFRVPREVTDRLHRQHASPFMVHLAGFTALLAALTGQRDIAVGTPAAGRALPELESVLGLLANTLVLRTDLTDAATFDDVVGRVRDTVLEAHAHRSAPFPHVVRRCQSHRDPRRNPLFDVMFALDQPAPVAFEVPGAVVRPVRLPVTRSKFDLSLTLTPTSGGELDGSIVFATDVCDRATVERIAGRHTRLLGAVAADPQRDPTRLPLDPAELRTVHDWSRGRPRDLGRESLVDLILAQAARTPHRPAVTRGDAGLDYRGLADRSAALAGRLHAHGVTAEEPVAVFVDRGVDLVVALLAVLRAGGCYLPLDPAASAPRVADLLAGSGCRVALVDGWTGGAVPWDAMGVEPIQVADADHGHHDEPTDLDRLAYLIHTSGSTGRPKGVMVTHGNLVDLARDMIDRIRLTGDDVVAALTTVSFDIAVLELLVPLAVGARVEVLPRQTTGDGHALGACLATSGATVVQATPTGWGLLLDAGWSGAPVRALCGGEPLTAALARRLAGRVAALWNVYGPTETTVWSTAERIDGHVDGAAPSIGRPTANTTVRVLDDRLRPVAVGSVGELYLGGPGVARGYAGQPALTAVRFVPDPFADTPGARLYATGDLVRFRGDGRLEFRGRRDGQVKIRGHRVEVGEVEAHLLAHPDVKQAVVRAHGEPDDRFLVAYVVPGRPLDRSTLIGHLRGRLPGHLVPREVVELAALPLTPGGKVDRRRLTPPRPVCLASGHAAPRTDLEGRLVELVADVLGVDRVGIDEDFFAGGGDSLRAARLAARLRDHLAVDVPVRMIFERPTVAALAEALDTTEDTATAVERVRPRPPGTAAPLSSVQQRLWFLDGLRPGRVDYIVPSVVRLRGPLDPDRLHRALLAVVGRHDVLRTRFGSDDAGPVQVVEPVTALWGHVVDLAGADPEGAAVAAVRQDIERPFDLRTGPLLRAALYRLAADDHVLSVVLHHAVVDGWSLPVLWSEVTAHYRAGDHEPDLPPLPVQYGDYAHWERRRAADPATDTDLAHWRTRLAGATPTEVPVVRPRPPVFDDDADEVPFAVPHDVRERLLAVGRRAGATPFMVLLAAFAATVGLAAGRRDVTIGTPIAGRGRQYSELAGLIGPLLNTVVLRTDVAEEHSLTELVHAVRDDVTAATAHQDLPFERLVELLAPERDLSRHPLFQIMFALDGDESTALDLRGVDVEPVPLRQRTVKFDLSMTMVDRPTGLTGTLVFATALYDPATARGLTDLFQRVLAAAGADPHAPLRDLDALDPAAAARLTPAEPSTGSRCLHDLVTAVCRRRPDAVAIRHRGRSTSFAELDRRSNQLAHRLAHDGIGPGDRVGVLLPPSTDLVTALLAVLKAGAAYVPMDPSQPRRRVDDLLDRAGVRLVLTDVDAARHPHHPLPPIARPGDLAYLTFTSGSTGTPKAVPATHADAATHLERLIEEHRIGPRDTVLQLAALSFDAATRNILGTLAAGACLVFGDARPSDPHGVLDDALRHGVTALLSVVPSVLTALVAAADRTDTRPDLRLVLTSGEELTPTLARRARCLGRHLELVNQYGPTECTMTATFHRITDDDLQAARLPLGRPHAGRQAVVLSAGGRPLPTGAVGELYLGGYGLASGYVGDARSTAQRFVPNPFGPPGSRLYRTGDLARFGHDGRLYFHGRTDRQLKIRGVRVEPAEVEAVLLGCPGVAAAAVTGVNGPGGAALVAYLVPADEPPDVVAIRRTVAATLPEQLRPARYRTVTALPLTDHGKLDRRTLADLPHAADPAPDVLTPRDRTELRLVRLFEDLLGRTRVDPRHSFFDLGGHSLLAVALVDLVHDRTGVRLPLDVVFRYPTAELLAARLTAAGEASARDRLVVPLAGATADGPPLFLLHPQSGEVCSYVDLARELEGWRPVHGVEAVGYSTTEAPLDDIPAMADRYAAEIRAAAGAGPYLLAGWSFGGNVALETAARLERDGTVAFLGILDARAFGVDAIDDWYADEGELARFAIIDGVPRRELDGADDEAVLAILTRHLSDTERLPGGTDHRTLRRMIDVFTANGRAADRYRAGTRVRTELHLFKATERHPTLTNPPVEPESWRARTTGRLTVIPVPGNHHDLASPPHVAVLAARLRTAVDAALAPAHEGAR